MRISQVAAGVITRGRIVVVTVATGIATLTSCVPFHVPALPPARPDAIGHPVSRADAIADLDTMIRVLEDVHPNLYAIRSRESTLMDRRHLVAELPERMTRVELWMRLAPFVSKFGDGHTAIYMPGEEIAQMQRGGALLFPAAVAFDADEHLMISAVFGESGGLRRGDRLVSINGAAIDSATREWMDEVSGESSRFRAEQVAGGFRTIAMIHGVSAPFTTAVIGVDGARRTIIAAGITQDSLRAALLRRPGRGGARPAPLESASFRVLQPGVGYLNIRGFDAEPSAFARRMTDIFTQATTDSDRALIIDLRSNPGGDSRLADELLRHITTTPYRMNARKDWKMSAEYRAYLRSFLSPPLQWLHAWDIMGQGRAAFRGPDGSVLSTEEQPQSHQRADPFFNGAVCVLIGSGTFSSASDVADAIKTYHLATLVGDETGGRVNTFGEGYEFRLPRSQLQVQVSSAYFVRASGDTADHRGVLPDVPVVPTVADRATSRDIVLEAATRRCGRPAGLLEPPTTTFVVPIS
jgi:hypothetical protein